LFYQKSLGVIVKLTDYTDESYWISMVKMSLSRYFVFHALSLQPMHGYAISKWIGDITGECCKPTEGSLYPLLKELEDGGYVLSQTELVSGRKRKIYTLTPKGLLSYKKAVEVWETTANLILQSVDRLPEIIEENPPSLSSLSNHKSHP
jgi:DNA-binding PadR family transcriptional regulator